MKLRIGLVLAVLCLLGVAYRLHLLEQLAEPARFARTVVELGPWGYLAFVLAYTFFQPFGVPGTAFILAAPLIWPWPEAFALSMAGTMGASVVGFSFSRTVARAWVEKRIPARFRKYEDALERRGFATVFFLRLVFWMPQMLHAFLGVSRVSFWTHFWGSLAGYVLPLLVVSYFGQKAVDAMRHAPAWVWLAVVAALLTAVGVTWAVRRYSPARCRA